MSAGHLDETWDINPLKTVDGEFMVCSGKGHGYGLIATVLDETDANAIVQLPALLKALDLALSHIEHMAAWITAQKAGYSFESLGEDMPDIRAALAAAKTGGAK